MWFADGNRCVNYKLRKSGKESEQREGENKYQRPVHGDVRHAKLCWAAGFDTEMTAYALSGQSLPRYKCWKGRGQNPCFWRDFLGERIAECKGPRRLDAIIARLVDLVRLNVVTRPFLMKLGFLRI